MLTIMCLQLLFSRFCFPFFDFSWNFVHRKSNRSCFELFRITDQYFSSCLATAPVSMMSVTVWLCLLFFHLSFLKLRIRLFQTEMLVMTPQKSTTHKRKITLKKSKRRSTWVTILTIIFIVLCFAIVLMAIWGRLSQYHNLFNHRW